MGQIFPFIVFTSNWWVSRESLTHKAHRTIVVCSPLSSFQEVYFPEVYPIDKNGINAIKMNKSLWKSPPLISTMSLLLKIHEGFYCSLLFSMEFKSLQIRGNLDKLEINQALGSMSETTLKSPTFVPKSYLWGQTLLISMILLLDIIDWFALPLNIFGLPWWLRQKSICLQCRRPRFNPWVEKIPWRRKWQPTPVLLPGKFHGLRSLVGYSPWGGKSQTWLSDFTFFQHYCSRQPTKERNEQVNKEICITSKYDLCLAH